MDLDGPLMGRRTSSGRYPGHDIERLLDDLPPLPASKQAPAKATRVESMTEAERSQFYGLPISPDIPAHHRQVVYPYG